MTFRPRLQPTPSAAAASSDAALVDSLGRGDGSALAEVVHRFGSRVHGYLSSYLGDANRCDEITQETFVRLFERPDAWDRGKELGLWLLRVAHNLATDLMRREGRRRRVLQGLVLLAPDATVHHPERAGPAPDADVAEREFTAALDQALETVPQRFRAVFVLREFEGLAYGEIGEVLGLSPKTVSSRLHRARLFLQGRLRRFTEP